MAFIVIVTCNKCLKWRLRHNESHSKLHICKSRAKWFLHRKHLQLDFNTCKHMSEPCQTNISCRINFTFDYLLMNREVSSTVLSLGAYSIILLHYVRKNSSCYDIIVFWFNLLFFVAGMYAGRGYGCKSVYLRAYFEFRMHVAFLGFALLGYSAQVIKDWSESGIFSSLWIELYIIVT